VGAHQTFCKKNKKDTTMRGRMPYPMPFIPMLIVAFLIAAIFPTLLKMCRQQEIIQDSGDPSVPEQTENQNLLIEDPFAEMPTYTQQTDKVRITTKFVEVGSGTEELAFDWIRSPFDQSTSKE
jgi:hypothetical protein